MQKSLSSDGEIEKWVGRMKGIKMGEITDEVCEKCGAHADLIEEGTPLCASCFLEKTSEK